MVQINPVTQKPSRFSRFKPLLVKLAAGGFLFFLLKGIVWLVVMFCIAKGIF